MVTRFGVLLLFLLCFGCNEFDERYLHHLRVMQKRESMNVYYVAVEVARRDHQTWRFSDSIRAMASDYDTIQIPLPPYIFYTIKHNDLFNTPEPPPDRWWHMKSSDSGFYMSGFVLSGTTCTVLFIEVKTVQCIDGRDSITGLKSERMWMQKNEENEWEFAGYQ